jgi:hypothetical protein
MRGHGESKALLNLAKDPELQSYIGTHFPRLHQKSNSSSARVYAGAFNQGQSEGRSLILHKGVESHGRNSVKGLEWRRLLR